MTCYFFFQVSQDSCLFSKQTSFHFSDTFLSLGVFSLGLLCSLQLLPVFILGLSPLVWSLAVHPHSGQDGGRRPQAQ